MSRELRSYLLECYLPSTLFVVMSWGGFCVIPEIVPGRMVLLVTTLLSLVTMIDTVRYVNIKYNRVHIFFTEYIVYSIKNRYSLVFDKMAKGLCI